MEKLHAEFRRDAHAYTRSKSPWIIRDGAHESACARLIRYISGGGMRTFGRTVRQDDARLRQTRFLAIFGALAVLWFLLLVF